MRCNGTRSSCRSRCSRSATVLGGVVCVGLVMSIPRVSLATDKAAPALPEVQAALATCSQQVAEQHKALLLCQKMRQDCVLETTRADVLRRACAKLKADDGALLSEQTKSDANDRDIDRALLSGVAVSAKSVQALQLSLGRVTEAYDDCMVEAATPWYFRWEFWLGTVLATVTTSAVWGVVDVVR